MDITAREVSQGEWVRWPELPERLVRGSGYARQNCQRSKSEGSGYAGQKCQKSKSGGVVTLARTAGEVSQGRGYAAQNCQTSKSGGVGVLNRTAREVSQGEWACWTELSEK